MLCMDTLQFSKYRSNAIPILSLILRNECPINMPPAAYLVYGVWHLRGGEGRTNIENGSIVYIARQSLTGVVTIVTKTWNDPQRSQNYLQLQFCMTINNISYCLWIHHIFYYCKAFDPNPDLHANRWDLKCGE